MVRTKAPAAAKSVAKASAKAVAKSQTVEDGAAREKTPNPVWFKPLMFGFMLLGLAWLLVYYISDSQWPVASLGNINIAIGIGIMLIGFLMTTRWR